MRKYLNPVINIFTNKRMFRSLKLNIFNIQGIFLPCTTLLSLEYKYNKFRIYNSSPLMGYIFCYSGCSHSGCPGSGGDGSAVPLWPGHRRQRQGLHGVLVQRWRWDTFVQVSSISSVTTPVVFKRINIVNICIQPFFLRPTAVLSTGLSSIYGGSVHSPHAG